MGIRRAWMMFRMKPGAWRKANMSLTSKTHKATFMERVGGSRVLLILQCNE
jgi:hypothetical protein